MKSVNFFSYLFILSYLSSLWAVEDKINIGYHVYQKGMVVILQDRIGNDNTIKHFMRQAPTSSNKNAITIPVEGIDDLSGNKTIKTINGYQIEEILPKSGRCCWAGETIVLRKINRILGFPATQSRKFIETASCSHRQGYGVEECPFKDEKSLTPHAWTGLVGFGLASLTALYYLWPKHNS